MSQIGTLGTATPPTTLNYLTNYFLAYNSTDQTGATGSQLFEADSTTVNNGGVFDTTNFRWTAPATGVYYFGFQISIATTNDESAIFTVGTNPTHSNASSIFRWRAPEFSFGDNKTVGSQFIWPVTAGTMYYFFVVLTPTLTVLGETGSIKQSFVTGYRVA